MVGPWFMASVPQRVDLVPRLRPDDAVRDEPPVALVTTPDAAAGLDPVLVASRVADLVTRLAAKGLVSGLVLAGGDGARAVLEGLGADGIRLDGSVATGVPRDRALVVEDGGVVDLAKGRAKVVGRLECGYIFVDGSTVGNIGDAELTDRKILGADGFISVVVVVNLHSGTLVSGPDIHARGFVEDDSVFEGIKSEIVRAVEQAMADGSADVRGLQQVVRRTVGRWVSNAYRRRPMILPVVVST